MPEDVNLLQGKPKLQDLLIGALGRWHIDKAGAFEDFVNMHKRAELAVATKMAQSLASIWTMCITPARGMVRGTYSECP